MASKGQKFKHYSPELKKIVVDDYHTGKHTLFSLAQKYNVTSPETVLKWIRAFETLGMAGLKERRGSATRKNSPFKGRPRRVFKNDEERDTYMAAREAYLKQKALQAEERAQKKNKIKE